MMVVAMFLPLGPNQAPATFVVQLITNGIPMLMNTMPKVGEFVYASHNPRVVRDIDT